MSILHEEERLKVGKGLANGDAIALRLLSLYRKDKDSDKGTNNLSCFLFAMKIHTGIHVHWLAKNIHHLV